MTARKDGVSEDFTCDEDGVYGSGSCFLKIKQGQSESVALDCGKDIQHIFISVEVVFRWHGTFLVDGYFKP